MRENVDRFADRIYPCEGIAKHINFTRTILQLFFFPAVDDLNDHTYNWC